MEIYLAETAEQLARCYPVMAQLRPHLSESAFIEQVQRQQQTDRYQIACLEDDGHVRSVAGFRWMEKLANGSCLYVDDLVTDEAARSRGYGDKMLDWLVERARAHGCDAFILDSGVHRARAHRFYFRKGMHIADYHFILKLHDFETT